MFYLAALDYITRKREQLIVQQSIRFASVWFSQGMRHSWKVIQTFSPSIYAWLHPKAKASLMLSDLSGDDAMMALSASIFMT